MTKDNLLTSVSKSISVKLGVIFFLILIMQIPLSSVRSLIHERQNMENKAHREISQRWGDSQQIATPVLVITRETQAEKETVQSRFTLQSNVSDFVIDLKAQKRYLGIYQAAVYQSKIKLTGSINVDLDVFQIENSQLSTQLFVPIRSLTGLKNIEQININGKKIKQQAYQQGNNQQVGFAVGINKNDLIDKILSYEIEFSLAGSQQFDLIPNARKTTVSMQSNWSAPSFVGDYLPDERSINDEGFKAQWQVNKLNLAADTTSNFIKNQQTSFGVKIYIPANTYQVNERTVKYSFLIILLTFAGFFLSELFFKIRLHPFQYLLIGFSISTFYLLLLSLSEYLHFNLSFLISASAIIALISGYSSVVLHQKKRGVYTGILFAILYGFIFILVKAEQTSLLMGSLGILFILTTIMYLTRKINWYEVGIEKNE